jgi:hypothetical protein
MYIKMMGVMAEPSIVLNVPTHENASRPQKVPAGCRRGLFGARRWNFNGSQGGSIRRQ